MCVMFTMTIKYIGTLNVINEKLLDYELVSIDDYSIKGRVSKELYEQVIRQEQPAGSDKRDLVPIRRFKKYLIKQIEQSLMARGLTREQSQVADVAFAFNNRQMLHLLKKRYEYLCKAKF